MIDVRLGDCLELMKELPDKSIDLIIADPPYMMTAAKCDKCKIDVENISGEIKRIVKDKCAWIIFGQTKSIAEWIYHSPKLFKYSIVWDKRKRTGFFSANKRPLRTYELINVFGQGSVTYNPQMTMGKPYRRLKKMETEVYSKTPRTPTESNGERYPVDIISVVAGLEHKVQHPFKKPVELMEWLVKTYSNEGETILDPFMGSGSSGVACMRTGRNFIGFEIDPGYFEMAKKRIEEAE